ncbi:MAG: hypothetical protein K2X76_07160, partial [Sphingomonas sp.]|nr:hypothetical protein [Sphingomonas sp.]
MIDQVRQQGTMMMILLALSLAAAEAPPALAEAPRCRSPQIKRAGRPPEARIEPLDRQPDAEEYLAVWRS